MKPTKFQLWQKRSNRVRKQIGNGTATKPRLVVSRSNSSISAQVINDLAGTTLAAAHSLKDAKGGNIAAAETVGKAIADAAKKAKIDTVIFDRNGHKFHGRIKALAEAARKGGLKF